MKSQFSKFTVFRSHNKNLELYKLEPENVQSTNIDPLKLVWISSEFSKLQSMNEDDPNEQKSTSAPEKSHEIKLDRSRKQRWKEAPVNIECWIFAFLKEQPTKRYREKSRPMNEASSKTRLRMMFWACNS
ncbi:hypothetical protein SPIRO4BDMA_51076 [uncultured spirochete]|uniref:Uncharacterized protein n=1 Tax=uncultured spirochete TaxID=156406 RepID=A0A3P3XTE1_9SPIR|nr:hypothetical protein SPIRO4BDMA_51076 [uncultured spirochete]